MRLFAMYMPGTSLVPRPFIEKKKKKSVSYEQYRYPRSQALSKSAWERGYEAGLHGT